MKIIHDDLKPENILLHKGYAKICDFGSSTEGSANTSRNEMDITHRSNTHTGTLDYMSMQRLLCEQYSQKADVFSLGLIIVEILTGGPAKPRNVCGDELFWELIGAYNEGWNPSKLLGLFRYNPFRYDPFRSYELAFMCLCIDESERKSSTECLEYYSQKKASMPSRESVCAEMSGSFKGGSDKAMQVLHFCIFATAVVGFFLCLCWAFCS
jgi:serine/threonine protein kinase